MKNGDKPAYPTKAGTYRESGQPNRIDIDHHVTDGFKFGGLTKREMFAMAAMQGLIAAHPDQIHNKEQGASLAVAWADELLKQLETQQ